MLHHSSGITADAASQQANKALCFTFVLRLADTVSNHDMKILLEISSVFFYFDVHVLLVALDGVKVPILLQDWSCTSTELPLAADNGLKVT